MTRTDFDRVLFSIGQTSKTDGCCCNHPDGELLKRLLNHLRAPFEMNNEAMIRISEGHVERTYPDHDQKINNDHLPG